MEAIRKYPQTEMGSVMWFTADTHFSHANIIKYSHRPFKSAEEMNEVLIANINEAVRAKDFIYHLGDWSFGRIRGDKTNNAQHFLDQISCKNIVLITGNHDPHNSSGAAKCQFADLFAGNYQMHRIKVSMDGRRQEIVLNHYAMRVWNKSHHGAWHLFGHSHGTLPEIPGEMSCDVGVDAVALRFGVTPKNYRPVSLFEISQIMEAKKELVDKP